MHITRTPRTDDPVTAETASSRQTLRSRLTRQRQRLSAPERLAAARGLRQSLEQLPEYLIDERVAGYWASAGELPLNLAVAPLAERGQRFYLPVVGSSRCMQFAPWQMGEEVAPNRFGIPEPTLGGDVVPAARIELVLVPLVGFDRHGNRIGFGGGYYDTTFAFLHDEKRPTTPLMVGIGYAFQECAGLEAQPWDVRLDYIATERELIDCTEPEIT